MFDWLKEKVVGLFAPKYIGAFARAIVQAMSGLLIGWGLKAEEVDQFAAAAEPIIVGIAGIVLSLVWSFSQKKKHSE